MKKNINKMPGKSSFKKRYSKEEIEFYNNIEVKKSKKGLGIIRILILTSIITSTFAGIGYYYLGDFNIYMKKVFYPDGLTPEQNTTITTTHTLQKIPAKDMQ